jgi:2-C-methyl-D-erythritol 4-phosphate cytidylyltransferase/2-C-methyl-D-erythritol 2,4-cyclodiphosphate synthase
MGGETSKQFLDLGGRSVLVRSVSCFDRHPMLQHIVVVLPPDDLSHADALVPKTAGPAQRAFVAGGETRQASVQAGMAALAAAGFDENAIILVHDAARPFISEGLITRAIAAADSHGAAVPGLPVADTIKLVTQDGTARETLDRAALRAIQTPQAFRFGLLREAHVSATASAGLDDAVLVEALGLPVHVFPGEADAFKLTTPDDLLRAQAVLQRSEALDSVTGTGFDVHAFGPGNHVTLAGVDIAHDHGLVGHSDADVGLHALTDAILGALGDGDIGQHFPPSDPQWRGAPSRIFLEDAVRRVRARGARLVHLDLTFLCEAPKIGPHRRAMVAAVSAIAGLAPERIGVKATTTERLGFTGRREGIAALATATVQLPRIEV